MVPLPRLEIVLLGGIRLRLHGREITEFRTQKVASLLAYLALHHERLHSRVELATLLFPDREERLARANLRTALYHLKELLRSGEPAGQPFLAITRQALGFNSQSDYWLDIEEFERLLEQASHAERPKRSYEMRLKALSLYRGDFLAGHYEDWSLHAQERLRSRYQEALASAAEYEAQNGLTPQAIAHLQEQLAMSPLQEEVHRRLIRLFLDEGDHAAAWVQYRLCERVLAVELGVAPDPETQALRTQLEVHSPSARSPQSAAHKELERGQRALARGHARGAERLLQSARRRLAEAHDPAEAEAIFQLARIALHRGDFELARRRFHQIYRRSRREQDTALQATALNGLGAVEAACGQLRQARELYQRALHLAEQGHHADVRWWALNNLGRNAWLQGRYDEALRFYTRAQLLCEQLCDERGILITLQNQGTVYSHLGSHEEAQRCYEEAYQLSQSATLSRRLLRSLWHNWGDVYERQGETEEALRCYRRSYKISWELDDELGCAASLCALGRVTCALGDSRRAERYLARAFRRIEALKAPDLELEAYCVLSCVKQHQGELTDARAWNSRALELLYSGVTAEEPERVYLAHAEILQAAGDHSGAEEAVRRAWEVLQERAERIRRADYRTSFLENVPHRRRVRELLEPFDLNDD